MWGEFCEEEYEGEDGETAWASSSREFVQLPDEELVVASSTRLVRFAPPPPAATSLLLSCEFPYHLLCCMA